MVLAVVLQERIGLAVQRKFTLRNTITVAANDGSEVRFIDSVDIVFHTVVAKCHIGSLPVSVGNDN